MIYETFIKDKLVQTYKLLDKHRIDCWIIYSNGSDNIDPALSFFNGSLKLQQEILMLIFKNYRTEIFTVNENFLALESLGYNKGNIHLIKDVKNTLKKYLKEEDATTLGLNKSKSGFGSGINHVLYQSLLNNLSGLNIAIKDAGPVVYSLTSEQTQGEKQLNRALGFELLKTYGLITQNLRPGWTFKSMVGLLEETFHQAKLEFSEFFSNDLFLTHKELKRGLYNITDDPLFEPGNLLNLFLGLKNINTHLFATRSWYILKPGEHQVPEQLNTEFKQIQSFFTDLIKVINENNDPTQALISSIANIEKEGSENTTLRFIGPMGSYSWSKKAALEKIESNIFNLGTNQLFYLELATKTRWGLLQQGEMICIENNESKFLIPPQKQIWAVQWFDDEQIREVIDK